MLHEILTALAQYTDLDYYISDWDEHEIYILTVEDFDGDEEEALRPFRQWCVEHSDYIRDTYMIGDYTVVFSYDFQYYED